MAKRQKRDKSEILTRTEKWYLTLGPEEERLVVLLSDGLRDYCNMGLALENKLYEIRELVKKIPKEPAPTVEELPKRAGYRIEGLSPEQEAAIADVADALIECYLSPQEAADVRRITRVVFAKRLQEKETKKEEDTPAKKRNTKRNPHTPLLTPAELYLCWSLQRKSDAAQQLFRSRIPANWVVETFGALVGAHKSALALIARGDKDAHFMRSRPEWLFQAIPGCSAFSIKGGRVVLAPEIFPGKFSFPIPATYQALKLGRMKRLSKFVIKREERDLRKPSRFTISVLYELEKPEQKPVKPEEYACIAHGASSIGIVSLKNGKMREELIEFWRPDKGLKPEIARMARELGLPRKKGEKGKAVSRDGTQPPLTKGSKTWRRLYAAYLRLNRKMEAQQTQDRREVVARRALEHMEEYEPSKETRRFEKRRARQDDGSFSSLANALGGRVLERIRGHGTHFVVIDYDVRSKKGRLADSSKKERGGELGLNWAAQNTGSIGRFPRWLENKAPEFGGTVIRIKLPIEAVPHGLLQGHENKIAMAHAVRDHFLKSVQEAA